MLFSKTLRGQAHPQRASLNPNASFVKRANLNQENQTSQKSSTGKLGEKVVIFCESFLLRESNTHDASGIYEAENRSVELQKDLVSS